MANIAPEISYVPNGTSAAGPGPKVTRRPPKPSTMAGLAMTAPKAPSVKDKAMALRQLLARLAVQGAAMKGGAQ